MQAPHHCGMTAWIKICLGASRPNSWWELGRESSLGKVAKVG